jgi:integrase
MAKAKRLPEAMRVIYLEPTEAEKLLAGSFAFRDPRFVAFVHLLHDTGARVSELTSRRVEDIDFDKRTILADKTKTDRPRLLFFSEGWSPGWSLPQPPKPSVASLSALY